MLATGAVLIQQKDVGSHGVIPASLLGGLFSLHSANIPRCESVPSFTTGGVKEEAVFWFTSFEETTLGSKYLRELLVNQSVDFR